MNSLIKRALYGSILLFLSACAHYPNQVYYPPASGGVYPDYSSGYVVTPGIYNGGYPYRYGNYAYPVYGNYRHDPHDHTFHDGGYNTIPSWNYGRLKANPSHGYTHHPERKNKQWAYKEPVSRNLDHPHHKDNDYRRKQQKDNPQKQINRQHDRANPKPQIYGQQQRPDDRRDYNRGSRQSEWTAKKPVREQGRSNANPDKNLRNVNQEQLKRQRKNRNEDYRQSIANQGW